MKHFALGHMKAGKKNKAQEAKPSKYLNQKDEIDGISFDSKREANRYSQLKLMERAGQIRDLELQKRFPIRINDELICHYLADFVYRESHSGKQVVEDVKSAYTRKNPVYRLKNKLMRAVHGVTIKEV